MELGLLVFKAVPRVFVSLEASNPSASFLRFYFEKFSSSWSSPVD
jgi:hypothetical protein